MPTVRMEDWLELLGLTGSVQQLLAGQRTLSDAREDVESAKTTWPGVSQDFVSVLDQLNPFFDDVADVISEQHDLIDEFNNAVGEFGETFPAPQDRLLNEEDLGDIADIRDALLDFLAELHSQIESIVDEIEDLLNELESQRGGLEEGDPFLADEIAETLEELEELQEALEGEGCLGP